MYAFVLNVVHYLLKVMQLKYNVVQLSADFEAELFISATYRCFFIFVIIQSTRKGIAENSSERNSPVV